MLYPYNASSYIFSGSAVIDVNNTSGFFPNQTNGVVAFYTIATYEPILLQSQGIAYSYDNGYTFTMYQGNPVLDLGLANFRDPKVIWYEDHWVMVVAYATDFVIGVFTSLNLIDWDHASNFSHHGLLGSAYECPNLVEVPVEDINGTSTDKTMWLLQISNNPGAPLGGSATQYFPGAFDGYTFTPIDGAVRFIDFSKDNYAGQFFYGTPSGQAIAIDWASNWQYCQAVPTGPLQGWRSAMSLPRTIALRPVASTTGSTDLAFVSRPVSLDAVFGESLLAQQNLTNSSIAIDFASVYSNAIYFSANTTGLSASGTLNFTFSSPISGEYLQLGVFFGAEEPVWVNRGGVRGFDNPFFTNKFSTSTFGGVTSVSGVIDRSLFEVFVNDGEKSGTTSFFAEEPLTVLSVASAEVSQGVQVMVEVMALQSTWETNQEGTGVVGSNISMGENVTTKLEGTVYRAKF